MPNGKVVRGATGEGIGKDSRFLDGSHDGDKTRERKRKGQEYQGKNNKKNSSLTKLLEALEGRGSNEVGRHCNNYL